MIDCAELLRGVLDAAERYPELGSRLRTLLGKSQVDDELVALADTGVSVRTLRRAIADGELEATKIGREYRVRRSDLNQWFNARRVAPSLHREGIGRDDETPAARALARAREAGHLRRVK